MKPLSVKVKPPGQSLRFGHTSIRTVARRSLILNLPAPMLAPVDGTVLTRKHGSALGLPRTLC